MSGNSVTLNFSSINGSFIPRRVTITTKEPANIGRLMDAAESQNNLMFPSKVVSRQHAKLVWDGNKAFIQDTKSSGGTFLNKDRLSPAGQESRLVEVHDGDMIQLGEDYEQNGVWAKCIQMKVQFPYRPPPTPVTPSMPAPSDYSPVDNEPNSYVDLRNDPGVRATVNNEFNNIWSSLTADFSAVAMRPASGSLSQLQSRSRSISEDVGYQTIGAANPDPHIARHSGIQRTASGGGYAQPGSIRQPAPSVDAKSAAVRDECIKFIGNQPWQNDAIKTSALRLAIQGDPEILTLYTQLKGYGAAFCNVVTQRIQGKSN